MFKEAAEGIALRMLQNLGFKPEMLLAMVEEFKSTQKRMDTRLARIEEKLGLPPLPEETRQNDPTKDNIGIGATMPGISAADHGIGEFKPPVIDPSQYGGDEISAI
jgi:hypothetical protein